MFLGLALRTQNRICGARTKPLRMKKTSTARTEIVSGIAVAAGGLSLDLRIFWGVVLVIVVFVVLIVLGRRRQKRAQAERSERVAARTR